MVRGKELGISRMTNILFINPQVLYFKYQEIVRLDILGKTVRRLSPLSTLLLWTVT